MISLRQEDLRERFSRIRVARPMARKYMHKEIGIGSSTLDRFWWKTYKISDISLDRLENYILRKEKELGISDAR